MLDPETKEEIGKSKIAASNAIWSSIYSRWIYLIPIFFSNPILEALARKMKIMPKGGVLKFIADLTFCGIGLATAIPILCAVSEQYPKLSVDLLEEDIRAKAGNKQFVIYNKGI